MRAAGRAPKARIETSLWCPLNKSFGETRASGSSMTGRLLVALPLLALFGCVTVHDPESVVASSGGKAGKTADGGVQQGQAAGGSAGASLLGGGAGGMNSGGSSSGGSSSGGVSSGGVDGTGGEQAPSCSASAECAPPTPHCSAESGRCVECLTNQNCVGTGFLFCDLTSFRCVTCVADTNCPSAAPYCAPSGDCVACLDSTNCGSSLAACDPVTYHCVASCGSDADCTADVGRPFCDVTRKLCVECVGNQDCPPIAPHCATAGGVCSQCVSDADCSGATPHCDPSKFACVACLDNSDCAPGDSCLKSVCTPPLM